MNSNEFPFSDPYLFFDHCFTQAKGIPGIDPTAVALSTCDSRGRPSSRVVLLKEIGKDGGFHFFTNYESRKASDLKAHDFASLLFFWTAIGRQIRIEGKVVKLSDQESDAYWSTRSRESRIGAIASKQSRPLGSKEELDQIVAETTARYAGKEVERPVFWGGYSLIPDHIEFWENGMDRLHERIAYDRDLGASVSPWKITRLFP